MNERKKRKMIRLWMGGCGEVKGQDILDISCLNIMNFLFYLKKGGYIKSIRLKF